MTENGEAKQYKADLWSLDKFVVSWKAHSALKDWTKFYEAMNADCQEATGTIVPPIKLSARLRICAQHLETMGYEAPSYPERPTKKPAATLNDAVLLAGLRKLP